MFAVHLIAVTSFKMSENLWKWAKVVEFLSTMGEFMILGFVIEALKKMTLQGNPPYWYKLEYAWLTIEFTITFAYILANICYMAVRFFTSHEMLLTERSLKSHPKTDFVDAHYANTNLIGASLSPLIISLYEASPGLGHYEDPAIKSMKWITLVQIVQVVLIFGVIFISAEKRRPALIMPTAWMIFVFALISQVISPIIICAILFTRLDLLKVSVYTPWLISIGVQNIVIAIQYVF